MIAPSSTTLRRRTVVIGPGIVGMPMAALLADATRRLDAVPGEVVVIQRASPTSGWKVDAINRGESPIGGVEPALDEIVRVNVAAGTLRASHDYGEVQEATTILVCVQTDKDGWGPEYGPLFGALHGIAGALAAAPVRHRPTIIIESTLAPSTMQSIVRPLFASYGLEEGRDVSLGNSPNRVMPGRLVERVAAADKIVGALRAGTASDIATLYGRIVTTGRLWETSSMAAEIVKTLENAYRDVRIAFATEVARWCDAHDVDFQSLREMANERLQRTDLASRDGTAVPSGALLVPTAGVGGHCLPKDGILLWWRAHEAGMPTAHSMILGARTINDAAPAATLAMATARIGSLSGREVAVLGAAYRADSEDTRNAPAITLATQLLAAGARVTLHDPFVRPNDANIAAAGLTSRLTRSLDVALRSATVVFVAVAHGAYRALPEQITELSPGCELVVDAANLYARDAFAPVRIPYTGIGRGRAVPEASLVDAVLEQFRAVERGVANEVSMLVDFFNAQYRTRGDAEVLYAEVQAMARSCATGCDLADPGPIPALTKHAFQSRLAAVAAERWAEAQRPAARARATAPALELNA